MRYLFILLILSSCNGINIVGDEVNQIYPREGYANTVTITKQCPVDVSEVRQRPLSLLQGYICISEEQFTKYRRALEQTCEE